MNLKDILEVKLNKLGIKKQVTASQVCDAYNKAVAGIFGENALKNTEAISFKNGTLKVRVANSSWSQEVQGRSAEIIERIENILGRRIVERLSFSSQV